MPRHGADGAAPPRARWRWDPGRRGVAAVGGAAVAIVAATGWWLAASRSTTRPVSSTSSLPAGSSLVPSIPGVSGTAAAAAPPAGAPPASVPASTPTSIVVDVAGKVVHPGVYDLPAEARVYDALRAAGGARPGVSTLSLNLAEALHDGEQIVVGNARGAAARSSVGATSVTGTTATTAPVDLNTATLEQLETLPGVGPVLGQNIVDYRTANGPFSRVDQLAQVSGIGDVRLAQLTPLVTV